MHADVLDATERPSTEVVRFVRTVVPTLESLGVIVEGLSHVEGAGELHVRFYLPTRERALREKALTVVQDFERAYAHTVTVSPSILYFEDREND